MSLKNKLQIYLVTYNRKKKFHETLETILAPNSPIKDYDITILDNASTDGTSELIQKYCSKFSNIKHIRHSVNIGGNANICRAFEMGASCGKDYFWVLCDDDKYDFSNWNEVEQRIQANDDIICVCDYICDTEKKKQNPAYQIFQLTFVPAGIYKSALITDDILINMYDAIITMFQQAVICIKCVNQNKKIYVLSKPIVFNGLHFEDKVEVASLSYTRGSSEKWISERRNKTLWIYGFANILSLLKNKQIQQECMEIAIPYKDIFNTWDNFYNVMYNYYINTGYEHYFKEIYNILPKNRQAFFNQKSNIQKLSIKNFLQHIFSLRNAPTGKHKIITILGFKIRIKHKK